MRNLGQHEECMVQNPFLLLISQQSLKTKHLWHICEILTDKWQLFTKIVYKHFKRYRSKNTSLKNVLIKYPLFAVKYTMLTKNKSQLILLFDIKGAARLKAHSTGYALTSVVR